MRVLVVLLACLLGCDDTPAGRRRPGTSDPGAGRRVDSGLTDTGTTATSPDASEDAGDPEDAAPFFFDARTSSDDASAPTTDAGSARPDAAFPDAMTVFPDAASVFPDAAAPDSGPLPGSGDVWIELDYSSAQSPRSPAFRYSNTPGWGAAQWAAVNASWPEAWDRFNNMRVVSDPIGTALEIGGGSELQLMIGLEELIAYDHATVVIEGRSRATSSSVQYDVYNPWNGCGDSGTFGQQWQVQSLTLDLSQCYELGQGVQAVRVDPTNGTIALVRLRLTLHGAVY